MIPNLPQQGPMHHMAHRRGANEPEMSPSAAPTPVAGNPSAPGQIAKAMIADAIASGAELPANIQGKAASAIARGIGMETFFASFMPAAEPPADDVPAGGALSPSAGTSSAGGSTAGMNDAKNVSMFMPRAMADAALP